jgi:hypothetical protein
MGNRNAPDFFGKEKYAASSGGAGLFSQTPLAIEISDGDEIWLNGKMVIFNGWPPNIRMIIMEDFIIGIDEDSIPEEVETYLPYGLPNGSFKLKLTRRTNIPYYEIQLLIFTIIDYKDIEIIYYE